MPDTGSGKQVADMLSRGDAKMTSEMAYRKAAEVSDPHNRFSGMLKSPELPPAVPLAQPRMPMRTLFNHDGTSDK